MAGQAASRRRSGGISKQGQRDIRCLLILGASAHVRQERARQGMKGPFDPWLAGLLTRRPVKVAAVARAAKTARIIWAVLVKDQCYRSRQEMATRRLSNQQSFHQSERAIPT